MVCYTCGEKLMANQLSLASLVYCTELNRKKYRKNKQKMMNMNNLITGQ